MWWSWPSTSSRPSKGPEHERSVERLVDSTPLGTLPRRVRVPGAYRRRLNESGWLADQVSRPACSNREGRPSLAALLTGAALFQMVRRAGRSPCRASSRSR